MSTLPPAGWFDDPDRPGGLRYWDGAQWTDARHDAPPSRRVGIAATAAPAPKRAFELPAAGWWQRAAALALDAVLLVALCVAFMGIAEAFSPNHPDWTSDSDELPPAGWIALGASALVGLLYPWLWSCADRGHTIGKRAAGIRVVDKAGHPVTPGRSALREIACKGVLSVLIFPLLLSYLGALRKYDKRTLHDLMAGTRVVKARGSGPTPAQADAGRDAFGNPL